MQNNSVLSFQGPESNEFTDSDLINSGHQNFAKLGEPTFLPVYTWERLGDEVRRPVSAVALAETARVRMERCASATIA